MLKTLILSLLLIFINSEICHSVLLPDERAVDAAATPNGRLPSNSIIDIKTHADSIWFGTGQGLAQIHLDSSEWSVIRQVNGIGRGGISALAITDTVMWAATAYTEEIDKAYFPAGGGVGYSRDGGNTWTWMFQPVDSIGEIEHPTTTNIQNVTYDIVLSASGVWITSWGGGLRRKAYDSDDWEIVTPDGSPFHPFDNFNHRPFSGVYVDGILWIGTAEGVNRTTNEGQSWTKYTDANGLSGNFVTAMAVQEHVGGNLVWAATWKAIGADEFYGASVTDNYGARWRISLSDSTLIRPGVYLIDEYGPLRIHNFGFKGDTVFAAADDGLWWHPDRGITNIEPWHLIDPGEIVDSKTGEFLATADIFSVASHGDSIWVGTDDGLAVGWWSPDGLVWQGIERSFVPAAENGESESYAYPSPFSPQRGHTTRLQFSLNSPANVTYEIYNFAMEQVYKSGNIVLPGGGTGTMRGYAAVHWNGTDQSGTTVANGVYFYKIKADSRNMWGKVLVLD